MNRRRFLQNLAVTGAALETAAAEREPQSVEPANLEGHTLLSDFSLDSVSWKVYEDLRTRDGVITFVSSRGATRVLSKTAEPVFAGAEPPYLGLSLQEIGASGPDLLADKLLAGGGDPDEQRVRTAAPPLGSSTGQNLGPGGAPPRLPWNTFVGTKNAPTPCRSIRRATRAPIIRRNISPSCASRAPRPNASKACSAAGCPRRARSCR
jgi:hypothetical protein